MASNDSQQFPSHPQSPHTPKGTMKLRLNLSERDTLCRVPDPEELPRGLLLSTSQTYVLRFLREKMVRCSPPSRSVDEPLPPSSGRQDTFNASQSPARKRLRIAQGGPSSDSTRTVLNFDSAHDDEEETNATTGNTPDQASIFKIPEWFSPHAVKKAVDKVNRATEIGVVHEKRNYRYHARVQRVRNSPSNLRKRRLQRTLQAVNPFHDHEQCCKRNDCYNKVGVDCIYEEYRKVNSMNPIQCRRYLISLLDERENVFRIKGNKVCSKFLRDTLGFSFDVQCSVKRTEGSRGSGIARCQPRENKRNTKRRYITNFITSLAKPWGDFMPHENDITLPIFKRTTLWNELLSYWEEKVAPTGLLLP